MADSDRIGGSSARQVILVVLGAFFAAIVLFGVWYFLIRTPYAAAFKDLKTADASIIVDELERQKVPYKLGDDGSTILVPKDDVDATRISILGGDLPLKGIVGFELFNKTDMGLTEFAQKINYQRALQGELARTLMSLNNIEAARVHLSLPDSEIFERNKRRAKASVTITPKLGETIDGTTVRGIQRLIASAVPELESESVAILNAQGQLLSQEIAAPPEPLAPEAQQTQAIEQFYAARVREAIRPVVTDPDTRVTVMVPADAKLENKAVNSTEDIKERPDDKMPSSSTSKRIFPLTISIVIPGSPAPGLRESLVPLLAKSVGYDPVRGDTLSVLAAPSSPATAQLPSAAPSPTMSPIGWGDSSGSFETPWLLWVLGLLAAVGVGILATRLFRTRTLSVEKREAFADKLKQLLDENEGTRSGAV
jgi:flagellar M-ring protein FliF